MQKYVFRAVILIFVFTSSTFAQSLDYVQIVNRSNALLEKLVNAKPISGCEQEAAAIIADRLKELELPFELIMAGDPPATPPAVVTDPGGKCLDGRQPSVDQRPNFIIRLAANTNGTKLKDMMIVAHMDVVPAIKQVWSPGLEAHKLTTKDGFIYGRGVLDMLSYLTLSVELFGEIKKNKIPLERDLVLMLNSDEEKGGLGGAGWLVTHRPELFSNVEYALSEGGATVADDNQNPLFIGYEAAQKRYQDFKISASGATGHSSTPAKIQAIELLNEAILKIKQSPALPRLIPLIKNYFQERAKVETDSQLKEILTKIGQASEVDSRNLYIKYKNEVQILEEKYPVIHALIRRTCTATVEEAGSASAKNAQPQTATAYVNCRLMPDETVDEIFPVFQKKINKAFGKNPTDPYVKIELDVDFRSSHAGASDINGLIPRTLKRYAQDYFKGIPVIPSMLTGATDLKFFRKLGIQAYGFGPVIITDSDRKRSHGIDERIYADNLKYGIEIFWNVIFDVVSPTQRKPASSVTPFPGAISKNFKNAFGDHHVKGDCQN